MEAARSVELRSPDSESGIISRYTRQLKWSRCGVPPTVLRCPRPGLFYTSFTLLLLPRINYPTWVVSETNPAAYNAFEICRDERRRLIWLSVMPYNMRAEYASRFPLMDMERTR